MRTAPSPIHSTYLPPIKISLGPNSKTSSDFNFKEGMKVFK
jgi:hypothetical protein